MPLDKKNGIEQSFRLLTFMAFLFVFYFNFQDHVVGAVLLSKKDTFLTRDEFNQLLFSTNLSLRGSSSSSTKLGKKVCVSDFEAEIQSVMPAIWKPEPLWTGKQVFINSIVCARCFYCSCRGMYR